MRQALKEPFTNCLALIKDMIEANIKLHNQSGEVGAGCWKSEPETVINHVWMADLFMFS